MEFKEEEEPLRKRDKFQSFPGTEPPTMESSVVDEVLDEEAAEHNLQIFWEEIRKITAPLYEAALLAATNLYQDKKVQKPFFPWQKDYRHQWKTPEPDKEKDAVHPLMTEWDLGFQKDVSGQMTPKYLFVTRNLRPWGTKGSVRIIVDFGDQNVKRMELWRSRTDEEWFLEGKIDLEGQLPIFVNQRESGEPFFSYDYDSKRDLFIEKQEGSMRREDLLGRLKKMVGEIPVINYEV